MEQRRCRSTAHGRSGLSRSRMLGGRRPLRSSMSSRRVHPTLWRASRLSGLSGQMLGVTLLDARDRPIRPALLWNDGRAGAECLDLALPRAGLRRSRRMPADARLLGAENSVAQLTMSRRRSSAHARSCCRRIIVRLCLSGEAVTDLADGSATLLMETRAGKWSDDIAQACGISTERLPRLIDSDAVSAELRPELAGDGICEPDCRLRAAPATTCAVRSEPA